MVLASQQATKPKPDYYDDDDDDDRYSNLPLGKHRMEETGATEIVAAAEGTVVDSSNLTTMEVAWQTDADTPYRREMIQTM